MTMKLHILAYGLVLATTVAACSDEKKDSKEKEGVETVLPSLPNEVTVVPLEKRGRRKMCLKQNIRIFL